MDSTDFVWNISFELKNENGKLVTFNCRSVIFGLSIKENQFFHPIHAKNINKIMIYI